MAELNDSLMERPFQVYGVLNKAHETAEGDWIVSGPVSSEEFDMQGESMDQDALLKGLEVFRKYGSQVDYNHRFKQTGDLDDIIGQGISFKKVDGKVHMATRLFKSNPTAQKVWQRVNDGGAVGYSVEGKAVRKSVPGGVRLTECQIPIVTIAPMPEVPQSRLSLGWGALAKAFQAEPGTPEDRLWSRNDFEPVVKALTAGSGIVQPGETSGAVLRVQEIGSEGPAGPQGNERGEDPAKMTKAEANYREGTEEQRCGNCSHMRPDGSCTMVRGLILADDVCNFYAPAGERDMDDVNKAEGGNPDMPSFLAQHYKAHHEASEPKDGGRMNTGHHISAGVAAGIKEGHARYAGNRKLATQAYQEHRKAYEEHRQAGHVRPGAAGGDAYQAGYHWGHALAAAEHSKFKDNNDLFKGYDPKGEHKSHFEELVEKLMKEHGYDRETAEKIAYHVGEEKYGKAGMEARAEAGREAADHDGDGDGDHDDDDRPVRKSFPVQIVERDGKRVVVVKS